MRGFLRFCAVAGTAVLCIMVFAVTVAALILIVPAILN